MKLNLLWHDYIDVVLTDLTTGVKSFLNFAKIKVVKAKFKFSANGFQQLAFDIYPLVAWLSMGLLSSFSALITIMMIKTKKRRRDM